MDTITVSEFANEFGFFQKEANDDPPVLIETGKGDPLAVITLDEYHRLKYLDREVYLTKDLPANVAQAIRDGEPSAEAGKFNDELDGSG